MTLDDILNAAKTSGAVIIIQNLQVGDTYTADNMAVGGGASVNASRNVQLPAAQQRQALTPPAYHSEGPCVPSDHSGVWDWRIEEIDRARMEYLESLRNGGR